MKNLFNEIKNEFSNIKEDLDWYDFGNIAFALAILVGGISLFT